MSKKLWTWSGFRKHRLSPYSAVKFLNGQSFISFNWKLLLALVIVSASSKLLALSLSATAEPNLSFYSHRFLIKTVNFKDPYCFLNPFHMALAFGKQHRSDVPLPLTTYVQLTLKPNFCTQTLKFPLLLALCLTSLFSLWTVMRARQFPPPPSKPKKSPCGQIALRKVFFLVKFPPGNFFGIHYLRSDFRVALRLTQKTITNRSERVYLEVSKPHYGIIAERKG